MNTNQLPKEEFVFGVASAAFQIEGAAREDGKGESIWDVMTHEPGKTKRGNTGDITCDHYHRYREDVRLMAQLGVTGYRFSVSWSRVLPNGTGEVNRAGIDFYSNLIDELLQNGIQPYLTLYHWDLPQKLFEKGGWLNPDAPEWFYEYARLIGQRFGDRVRYFITLNEPNNVIEGMTQGGGNAPALAYTVKDRLTAIHNLLKAHGRAVQALRETVPGALIGMAPCSAVPCPIDTDLETVEQARKRYFATAPNDLLGSVTLYSDPIFLGDYPKEYYEYYRGLHPEITPEDRKLISTPVDFCYQNIYVGFPLDRDGKVPDIALPENMLSWPIWPEALYWGPKFLYERYQKPIIITENGLPNADNLCKDAKAHDPERIDFVRRYTQQLFLARAEGVDIRGYFYWSILDNLEWELGFGPRFGLIHVDFHTLKRTPKDSYYDYQKLIQEYRKP